MKIAVIGSGVAGLGAAWLLNQCHDVHVFEADSRIGGHSNTVETPGGVPVDTGFIVYNRATYPNLIALFDAIEAPTEDSDMSFAVSLKGGRLEYCGDNLATLFAQKRNLFSPRFHGMWRDILRFYEQAPRLLEGAENPTLGAWLTENRYSRAFIEDHLLPMGAAIWSMTARAMMDFPARNFVRFFVNHGLLRLRDRIPWRTVSGGSREYVRRLSRPFADKIRTNCPVGALTRQDGQIILRGAGGLEETFDAAVLACHGDSAAGIMAGDADGEERSILGAFNYSTNRAVLHSDAGLMPRRRKAWASWNYMTPVAGAPGAVSVSYWMNRLQNIDPANPLFVTLNPLKEPEPSTIIREFTYTHPIFDRAANEAQANVKKIQGRGGVWYCGSWLGYGFHEDALASGLAVGEALGGRRPWQPAPEASPAYDNATPLATPLAVAA